MLELIFVYAAIVLAIHFVSWFKSNVPAFVKTIFLIPLLPIVPYITVYQSKGKVPEFWRYAFAVVWTLILLFLLIFFYSTGLLSF
jgi:hypothetical protein